MNLKEVRGRRLMPAKQLGPEPEVPPGADPRVGVPKDVKGKVYRVGHDVAVPDRDINTRLLYIKTARVVRIVNGEVTLSSGPLKHPENCLILGV